MEHIEAAVDYWNNARQYQGARSPEVRLFMNNPNNYVLELTSINRSNGGAMGRTYLPPATESEINKLFNINDLR